MDPSPDRPLEWRVLLDRTPSPGPANMALDHALADALGDEEGVVRLYGWSPPTISFGRNEPAKGLYDTDAARREGVSFVRRPTGGRAVLHAREVTYAAIFPLRALGGLRASYRRVNEGLVHGLVALGVPAQVSEDGVVLPPDAGPCFRAPAPGEVVLRGRKLVGSAQVRIRGAVLQHGSVILDGDQSALARIRGEPEDEEPPGTIASAGGETGWARVAETLVTGLSETLGGAWRMSAYSAREKEDARALSASRYATEAWTWRR